MFFYVSKILGFLATPSNTIALIGLLGLILLIFNRRRVATTLMATSVALVALFGFGPLGDALMLPLSERFPPWQEGGGAAPTGIIILGGSMNTEITEARGMPELNAAAERLTIVADLARRFPQARIVFSGGNANFIYGSDMTESDVAQMLFDSFGIPRSRVTLEDRSRTTAENANLTRDLIKPQPGERWLLVTSAVHMPRSVGAFRRAGFAVEAFPVDYRTRGWIDAVTPFGIVGEGLARTDTAIHEWVGLIAYRLSGRITELLPAP
jgi:uncharacterized SAM-binding protein YcdF (DUF218 family)